MILRKPFQKDIRILVFFHHSLWINQYFHEDDRNVGNCEYQYFSIDLRFITVCWIELEVRNHKNLVLSLCPADGTIILKSPASPVLEGTTVVLYCQHQTGKKRKTTFFKDGLEITTNASLERVVPFTIKNVTLADKGLYKCSSKYEKADSPGSWLSVIPDQGKEWDDIVDWVTEVNQIKLSRMFVFFRQPYINRWCINLLR